ncbi:hypothetical protein ANN_02793 [Periplaneta americana]|uniref:Uncharacterized protein n=1 Tax=Periplaneta americana TaxID=6978 RepID=A0ABQ8TX87_PERAM|nr:hypothetical protein ANN_02793 [Periplaneta americana]
MAGLCEGGNEPPDSLKAITIMPWYERKISQPRAGFEPVTSCTQLVERLTGVQEGAVGEIILSPEQRVELVSYCSVRTITREAANEFHLRHPGIPKLLYQNVAKLLHKFKTTFSVFDKKGNGRPKSTTDVQHSIDMIAKMTLQKRTHELNSIEFTGGGHYGPALRPVAVYALTLYSRIPKPTPADYTKVRCVPRGQREPKAMIHALYNPSLSNACLQVYSYRSLLEKVEWGVKG